MQILIEIYYKTMAEIHFKILVCKESPKCFGCIHSSVELLNQLIWYIYRCTLTTFQKLIHIGLTLTARTF